ncbi:ABC transporter permease [Picrophilus oshimae]|uniref:ABC-2 type transport system permease protein n=1 Tax=Picrophilus torridus (strain ATCC 700027 / DSM 9790 / JCM 10055 / NBRC 100828 / KAW 2/3) TaxID=1122961 RepID=Q6L2X0_PICTO|nr:ABC transporter permease [Picrophilus oshimae]AAT42681.1 ABC-type multidrug transport system, permease component [Picrophilus oshimae DSM 9789]SMD31471.1 ABC-2 type transport system permease protein [Picrophilus oshimae DSM 9789]
MNLGKSFKLMVRNILVNTDPGTLMFLVAMPAMYLIFMGFMFGGLINNIPGFNYKEFLTPGIMGFDTVSAGAIAGSLLWSDRRYGMFEQILTAPYTRSEYLFGILYATIFLSLIGSVILLIISQVLVIHIYMSAAGLIFMIVNIIIGGLFWGFLFLALAAKTRSNQAYNSIQIFIIFFADFASTVFYPLTSKTPAALKYMFYINPLTYIANGIRSGYLSSINSGTLTEFFILLSETIIMGIIAILLYRKVRVGTT